MIQTVIADSMSEFCTKSDTCSI